MGDPDRYPGRHVQTAAELAADLIEGAVTDGCSMAELQKRIADVIQGDRDHQAAILRGLGLLSEVAGG